MPAGRVLDWSAVLAAAVVPQQLAFANTGTLPPEFWLYLASLFVVIPGLAILAIARIVISWRKGLLGGLWVVAILAAAAFGGMLLWAHLTTLEHRTLLTWSSIYFALGPVAGIWIASAWSRKRERPGTSVTK